MTTSPIAIVAAARTPIGTFNGSLASLPAHALGAIVIAEVAKRAGVALQDIDEVVMGHVLQAGTGQGAARQAAMAAGLPAEKTAYSLNQLCGSGLRAVALGMQAIACGDAKIVVAGEHEPSPTLHSVAQWH